MRSTAGIPGKGRTGILPALLSVAFLALLQATALGFTLNVVDGNGTPITVGYRWLVEEDTTHPVTPGVPDNNSLGVSIHKSYAPVVGKGTSADLSLLNNPNFIDPTKRYVISVLPDNTYSLGGANVAAGQTFVRVICQGLPLPTAQISVLVFADNNSTNSAPDVPAESGLPGFKVIVFEQGGQVTTDVFGNNLGTTYLQNPDGTFQLDADGAPIVDVQGDGVFTDSTGNALVKNLPPGKFGIRAVPPLPLHNPPLDNEVWIQTTTIEGTPGIDAWVQANEPPLFNEAGFFFQHVFIGFVNPDNNATWRALNPPIQPFAPADNTVVNGIVPFFPIDNTVYQEQYGTITGTAIQAHSRRPPALATIPEGNPLKNAWVAVTNLNNVDEMIYAQPADPVTGAFTIPNVPPGTYQLAFWDQDPFMDAIISFRTVVVPPFDNVAPFVPGTPQGGPSLVALDNVPVAMWFGTYKGSVFNDLNRDGFRDPGETGIANQALNIRFRDGSIYTSTTTDDFGNYELIEVFPFTKWLIAEVDFATLEATGATIWIDNGGNLPRDPARPHTDELNPQPQSEPCANGSPDCRTEVSTVTAPILLEGMILYADQTQWIDWGKADYPPGKNGGITGITFYSVTRAEDDPGLGVGDPWEPGIPRVQVNLYADANVDGVIDDVNGDGVITLADVDNPPFDNFPGPEDIDRNGNGVFDGGDAINVVHADSWDDNLPTGCVAPDNTAGPINGGPFIDCAEILPYWNQVRPGLFDGGYGFFSYFPGGVDSGSAEVEGLPAGTYIVEVNPPPGYDIVKEEDKNVDFGDTFVPSTLALATPAPSTVPPCVGDPHLVPPELALFPGIPAFFAGQTRPLCDRKQVRLAERTNAAADFHFLTEVPKMGRFVGLVTNDVANTISLLINGVPNPRRGDKLAPAWMPIAFEDYQGNEIARVYSDQYGGYNVLVPSTYRINAPIPSGVGPGMVTVALNSPGPIESPPGSGHFIRDPFYNPAYTVFRLTFDLQPGRTTYLDTPVLPIGAFAANLGLLDCEFPSGTPVISQVDGPGGGPFVDRAGRIIRLTSVQDVTVGAVSRDFGFGDNTGIVTVGGVPLPIIAWTDTAVTARVPAGVTTGQLSLTRGDNGLSTMMGITLNVGGRVRRVYPGQSIQSAIDTAVPGDIILVTPGIYRENLVMWKPVKLQGSGAWSTVLDGSFFNPAAQAAWQSKVENLIVSGTVDTIPGAADVDNPPLGNFPGPEDIDRNLNGRIDVFSFLQEQGAVVTVFASDNASKQSYFPAADPARIDGFLITGAIGEAGGGGGIFANAFARNLQISNNKVQSNQGARVGGIRLGYQSIVDPLGNVGFGTNYRSAHNENVNIHHNQIDQNGGVFEPAAGGGIGLFNGSDNYRVTENWICGNFTLVYGAGISHFGLSDNGLIENNKILFNEAFDEGGGIIISGELIPIGADPNILTPGAGNVTINRNLIQGNLAGDDGGGIRTLLSSGQDVARNPADNTLWYHIDILNNIIVNNVSADSGGGISLDDSASISIINNTIAYNDSTGTSEDNFGPACHPFAVAQGHCPAGAGGGNPTVSTPVAAGLASGAHSARLQNVFDPALRQTYSNPILYNNIIWHNRSFAWDGTQNGGLGGLIPAVDNAGLGGFYWDLGVLGGAGAERLNAVTCILDGNSAALVTNPAANQIVNSDNNAAFPRLIAPYFNLLDAAAAPAGFITATFTPLGLQGDYHIKGPNGTTDNTASQAIDAGTGLGSIPVLGPPGVQTITNLGFDFDGEVRPFDEPLVTNNPSAVDIGADEFRRIVLP